MSSAPLRTLLLSLALLAASAMPRVTRAQSAPAVPQIVTDGFAAYVKGDVRAALGVWLKDSPASSAATIEQMVATIAPVEAAYGHIIGHDVLRVVQVGSAVRRVYVVMRYERGPMYAWFECYENAGRWIIPGFLTNTRASEIMPAGMF
jgi:hypothetical protein